MSSILPELRELAAPAVVMGPLARIGLRRYAASQPSDEIQHGSLDPLEQARACAARPAPRAGPGRRGRRDRRSRARTRGRGRRAPRRAPPPRLPRSARPRAGLARADEGADAQAVAGERDQRQGADELVTAEARPRRPGGCPRRNGATTRPASSAAGTGWAAASPGRGRPSEPARATSPSSESTVSSLSGACSLGASNTGASSETRAVTNG